MSDQNEPSNPSRSGVAGQPLDPQSVEGIFIEALGQAAGQPRRDFVEAACRSNAELRTRVEALLRAYDDAGSFLQEPAGDWRHPPVTTTAGSADAPDGASDHGIPPGLLQPSDLAGVLGTIGAYQVRDLIGRGGMGIVLRAFDAKLNRVVAIKALTPELAAQPTARRRFLREAQAAAAVTHPHVVTIHAVDEDDWPYLVMECIDGRSLQDKIEQSGTLKLAEVLRIGTQIAEGLAAAHKQGLMHRDVKPANVLLENGVERVKITDFGLAKAADDLTITRPGEISGTPQYMSPEQASGQRVDQRSDLFSLGCVLYAMCAGRPPFRADSMAAIVKKICDEAPQPLGEIDPDVPDWLAATIERLLAKDPSVRFQTAEEVARLLGDALARLQAGQAPAVVPPLPPSVSVPSAAQPAFPAWLLTPLPITGFASLALTGLAGYWFGRLMPMEPSDGWWLTWAALLATAILVLCGRRVRTGSATLSALLAVAGYIAFLVTAGFGHEQLFRYHSNRTPADWLAILAVLPVAYLVWPRRHVSRAEARKWVAASETATARRHGPGIPQSASLRRQPWKLAGWLVVAMLTFALLVPVVGLVAVLIPAYQAAQSRDDMRRQMADWGHLKLTFDEDLPIADIQIDGTSCGPIEISPVERAWAAGSHTVTVVYVNGERKRSVRTTVAIVPQKEQTLDLTPLVEQDMQERKKRSQQKELDRVRKRP